MTRQEFREYWTAGRRRLQFISIGFAVVAILLFVGSVPVWAQAACGHDARLWTSMAPPCWTPALSPDRAIRTGSTRCARANFHPSRMNSGRTDTFSPACGKAGLGSRPTFQQLRLGPTSRRFSSSSCSEPEWMRDKRHSVCGMPTANWASSVRARPGACSWIRMCFRIRSSTGDRTAWCSSEMFRPALFRGRKGIRL